MKILQVVTLSEVGGAQKVLYHIVQGLYKKDMEFHVACAPGGELADWLTRMGVKVYPLAELVRPISPVTDLKALLKLKKIMQREKYDLVHCHSSKAGIVGRLAAWLADVPRIIFTVHGWGVNSSSSWGRSLLGAAERVAGWVSTDVVCVSKADFRLGKKFVAGKKLRVIYNGAEVSLKDRGSLRQELGIGEKDVVVAMAARLKEPKEPLFFLRTAARLVAVYGERVHFLLAGDGPLREECEGFVREKHLEKQVHLLGTREDLIDLYSEFDVLALFSSWEGLPLTICEAMRAGLPIVASRVGGVGEQVEDGWNGFLLDSLDGDRAADYLGKLITDEELRREMGSNSRFRGEALFRLDRMVEEYEKLYKSGGQETGNGAR